jgi:ATP-dependent Clp protease ATP-binding subunit ClpC
VFGRFTDRARQVLVFAQDEAGLLGHNFIGTEHVLLGLLREGEGVAAKALASFDIGLETARQKVAEMVPAAPTPTGSPPFTPRSKKVLELSLREAMELGHKYIGTEHILLGLVHEGEGVAARVLTSLGAGLEPVRERVLEILRTGSYAADIVAATTGPVASGLFQTGGEHLARPRPPYCPYCQGALAGHLRYASMPAAPTNPDDFEVDLVLIYCENCGRYLGSTAGEGGPTRQAFS